MANSNTSELKVTGQYPLTMALSFILGQFPNITKSMLHAKYGLNRCTLDKILSGEKVPRKYDQYMCVCVKILYDRRATAMTLGNDELRQKIEQLFSNLLMVTFGLPTDQEIRNFELHKKYGV